MGNAGGENSERVFNVRKTIMSSHPVNEFDLFANRSL